MENNRYRTADAQKYLVLGGIAVAFCATILIPRLSQAAPICPDGITPIQHAGSYVCPRPQPPGTPPNPNNSVSAPDTSSFASCGADQELAAQWTGGNTAISVKCVSPGELPVGGADSAFGQTSPVASTPKSPPKPINCTATKDYWFNLPVCLMRQALASIGALFMWVGVQAVVLAGGLFELLVEHGIVKFGSLLDTIKSGIDAGWTAVRDIANIVIIGLFVFIAINIILGVKEFGEKRKIAQVLIVAVLINFSLLFTKVIVDASNFTAYQFYNSMIVKEVGSATLSTASLPGGASTKDDTIEGIAGRFLDILGVDGVKKSFALIQAAQETHDSALIGLGYGFFMLILLLATAFVFLYGAFLIASRAILIIFLMLTSALAFAAWLIPQQFIEKGFARWWESLLKAAFFAPILMALLWATVVVSEKLVQTSKATGGYAKDGALGGLAGAATTADFGALFNFVIVLGLLFASFVVANAFSKGIAGFSYARGLTGLLASAPLIAGSRALSFAGRNSLGWIGGGALGAMRQYYHRTPTQDEQHQGMAADAFDSRRQGVRGLMSRGVLRGTNFLARSSFDPLKVGIAQAGVGALGGAMARNIMGSTKDMSKDFMKAMSDKAKRADDLARQIGPTDGQKQEMREMADRQRQASQDAIQQQEATRDQFKAQERPAAQARARAAQGDERADAEASVTNATRSQDDVQRQKAAADQQLQSNMRDIERRIERARADAEHQAATPADIDRLMKPAMAIIERDRERHQQEHSDRVGDLSERARQHEEDLRAAKEIVKGLDEVAHANAEQSLNQHETVRQHERTIGELRRNMPTREQVLGNAERELRESLLWDPRAKPFVPDEMRTQQRRKDLRDITTILREEGGATPPATPPPPPPGPQQT